MRDTSVVELIVAGDVAGLAAAYDEYADLVYAYCRCMLGGSEETADATMAAFVNAASSAHRLRRPEHLHAWLFALARNQCLPGRRGLSPVLDTSVLDTAALPIAAASDADRTVLRSAMDGLGLREQDVFALRWHGLNVDEAAMVLRLSRDDVYALFSQARDQLEASVGVLLVCSRGRRDCARLDDLLGTWDGRMTARLRREAGRHIQGCDTCAGCRDRELRSGLLLSLTAGALLGAAEEARAMIRPAPTWLRERLLWLVMTDDPQAEVERRALGRRLAPFGSNGFPRPRRTTRTWLPTPVRTRPVLGMTGGLAALAVIVALIALPGGMPMTAQTKADAGMRPSTTAGGPVTPDTTLPASGPRSTPPSPTRRHTSAAASASAAATPTGQARRQAAPVITVSRGTVSVSSSSITVAAGFASTFTITAHGGGPVTWSVSVPSAVADQLSVSPSSGTLEPGQSATISVSAQTMNNFRTTLTISPGGHQVVVTVGLG